MRMRILEPSHVYGVLVLAKLAAEYLTMLAIAPYDDECTIGYRQKEDNEKIIRPTVYRLMPDELRDNSLRKQFMLSKVPRSPASDSKLCNMCKKVMGLYEACKLYLKELHSIADRDARIRQVKKRVFKTYRKLIEKHEEAYAPLYALYYINSNELRDILYRLKARSPLTITYNTSARSTSLVWNSQLSDRNPNTIIIEGERYRKIYRLQVFRRLSLIEPGGYGLAKLEHALLPTIWIERSESGNKLHLAMPRRDRSIHVTFISPLHIEYNVPIAAGLSTFLRSSDVEYGEKPEDAYMQLVVPSPSLQFSFRVFAENLARLAKLAEGHLRVKKEDDIISFECSNYNCFFVAFESDIDLTYISRSVLDKMLRLYLLLRTSDEEIDKLIEEAGDRLSIVLGTLLAD